jgi:hypothetical protein
MTANPLDQIEDQEDQEELVVEVEEEEAPAEEPAAPEPEPKAPRTPVEPAPAPEAKPAAEDDDDDASLSEKVRKRINKMTYKQRKAEREAQEYRQQLEALRQERETERRQYEARVGQSDDLIIASREEGLKGEMVRADHEYLEAYRSGDEAKLIAALDKKSAVKFAQEELLRVKQRRAAEVEARRTQQPQQINEPAPQAPQSDDWGKKVAKASELTEELVAGYAEWWDKDEVLTGSVISIDKRLKAEGKLKPWEPEFYEEIDRRMRARFPSEFGASAPASVGASSASRPSQPVAGVSRGPVKGSVTVRLSPEDKAFCVRNNISPEAYAKELHALERAKR